jgi:drug/metabolite transporter (DMT)-like permease
MTLRMAIALTIGAIGAIWVIFRADIEAFLQFNVGRGEVVYFFGCVAHAIYTPLVPKLNRGEPPVVFTFGMLLAGCAVLTAFGWSEIVATDWLALPVIVWVTVFYLAIFASAATFVLLQFAALNLPSAKVMAYTYLVPSWVILWEISLGNGAPRGLVAVGVAITIGALFMLLRDEH